MLDFYYCWYLLIPFLFSKKYGGEKEVQAGFVQENKKNLRKYTEGFNKVMPQDNKGTAH